MEDLEWQIDYEKKLHNTMVLMLEQKISSLLAEINKLEATLEEETAKRSDFDVQERKLQTRINNLNTELADEKIENEKLKFQIRELTEGVVTLVEHEKVQAQLNLAQSEIKYKSGRMQD